MEHLLTQKKYDNDLELAAELGKVLLDRNKELEAQIVQLNQTVEDRDQEIALLTKQVEVLRHANDSRMRIYEEVDKNAQELEKANEKLKKNLKEEKEKIKTLHATVESLEAKCDELQVKLEQSKRSNKKNKKSMEVEYNRTWSVPSLTDDSVEYKGLSPGSFDYIGFPSLNEAWKKKKSEANNKEIKDLKDTVKLLKLQYFAEQKRRADVESDLFAMQGEKDALLLKVMELQQDLLKKDEIKKEAMSAVARESHRSSDTCGRCSSRAASIAGSDIGDSEFIEHDLDELPRKEVVRLKCGGSAYGSKESLNLIGLEAVTPTLESCSDILAVAVGNHGDADDIDRSTQPDPDSTLLGELEEQYRKLVRKYEHLVDIKNKKQVKEKESQASSSGIDDVVLRRPKSLKISKEVQTAWRKSSCFDFTSPVDPVEGHFESGPPEYRKLFKEIFETLRSAATTDSPGSTGNTP